MLRRISHWWNRFIVLPALSAIVVLGAASQAVPANALGPAIAPAASVQVAEARATPSPVQPLDTLTLSVTLENVGARQDDLVVAVQVRAANGHPVLEESQGGVGVDPARRQAVYWVWRIPDRLQDGVYTVDVTVRGPDGQRVLDRMDRAASFAVNRPS